MRLVLAACLRQVTNRWRWLAETWNRFWFTPGAPELLGWIRILTGTMLLYTHAVWGVNLHDFFGPDGWLSEEAVRGLQADQTVFSFWWWVPSNGIVAVHVVALVVLALFTVGLFTRVTSILSFLIVISYANRVPAALFGLDQINAILTLYLAIGPSGRALSVDRLLVRYRAVRRALDANRPPPALEQPKCVGAKLAIRLIQVHLCVIYLFAGLSKLQGPAWWTGDAMWLAFANLEYQTADMTWLASYPWLINVMTHVTVLWEISFCVLVWRPSLKPLMLFMAVVLHVGIGACLGMWTFGLAMLIACSAFLPERFPSTLVDKLLPQRSGESEALTLVYHGSSAPSCRHACWIKALDARDRLELIDAERLSARAAEPVHSTEQADAPWPEPTPAEDRNGRDSVGSQPADDGGAARPDPAAGSDHAFSTAHPVPGKPTVLCLGKRTRTRKKLQQYLPRRGFWVMATSDPQRALSLLEANPPHCVLLLGALMTRDELGAVEERVRELAPPWVVSVTLLTAKQAEWASALRQTDVDRVLIEPISLREIRTELQEALKQLDGAQAPAR